MAVVDTSGSVTDDLLERIDAELARLARRFAVTVVECDRAIQRVSPYRGRLKSVLGRGGTDLRPPLQRDFLRAHRAELVVVFTDGFGPAPATPPVVPVIWCLTPGGKAPASWGRTITMDRGRETPRAPKGRRRPN
jgi:predicted metal-dependent peptidase